MKLGSYTIPRYRLSSLLEDTQKINDMFKNQDIKILDLAAVLKQQPNSGAFRQKLADMRNYGLLEGRGDTNRVSKLWKDAIYGTEDEKRQAYDKIVRNIPLWGELLDKNGASIKEDQFWVILRQITGVESSEAQEQANIIRKAYIEDIRYIKPVGKTQEPSKLEIKLDKESGDRKPNMEDANTIPSTRLNEVPNAILTLNYDYPGAMSGKLVVKDRPTLSFFKSLYDMAEEQLNARESLKQDENKNMEEKSGT